VKLVTAIASVTTALLLPPLIPKALALPSPGEVAKANEGLEKEIKERQQAEEQIRQMNAELE
jgi:hypothetical protein